LDNSPATQEKHEKSYVKVVEKKA